MEMLSKYAIDYFVHVAVIGILGIWLMGAAYNPDILPNYITGVFIISAVLLGMEYAVERVMG